MTTSEAGCEHEWEPYPSETIFVTEEQARAQPLRQDWAPPRWVSRKRCGIPIDRGPYTRRMSHMTTTGGFGDFDPSCPANEDGHEWSPPDRRLVADDDRCCVHCGTKAGDFLAAATAARAEFFGTLRQPPSSHGKKP